jgi:CBS domain-containing protein
MTVQAILSRKGNDVVTAEPSTSVAQAVKILAAKRIGAVVVTDGQGRIVGILYERDIVRAFAERGATALAAPIVEVMTRDVITCGIRDAVAEIMERMTNGRFRHVPVVDQGQLVGIISIGDVVKTRVDEMEQETVALRDYIRTA